MTNTVAEVKKTLQKLANPKRAKGSARYFKAGKGQYGEGDVFLGISVPEQRQVATKFQVLPLTEIKKLLQSKVHEHRFTGLEVLVMQYEKQKSNKKQVSSNNRTAIREQQKQIANFYLASTKYVNNWDLVDTSAPYILGNFLLPAVEKSPKKTPTVLTKLTKSQNLWERRIAIVSTLMLVSNGYIAPSLELAKALFKDKHDLIHKAVGWILREVGKKDQSALLKFLDTYASQMPRTSLRYAIERLPKKLYHHYLNA